LPGLALNCDPPDLCFLSSYDYRHKPPVPGSLLTLPVLYSLVTLAEGMFWVELCLPEWPKPQHLWIWPYYESEIITLQCD
jgi:hypothetical protein